MSSPHPCRVLARHSGVSYTAEFVEHADGDTPLAIADLDRPGCRSVTNAMEDVLLELIAAGVQVPPLIVYRDTEGVWDGVRHADGIFAGFYPIRETDLRRAIGKAVRLSCEPR